MPLSARAYLLDRFRSDAVVLRTRAASLAAAPKNAKVSGPDAETSRRMAQACDAVVQMIEAVPEAEDAERALMNITALVPLLEHHAAQEKGGAPVRAVYVGAATRIREVEAAEARARQQSPAADGTEGTEGDTHDGDDGEAADESNDHFADDDPDIDDDDHADDDDDDASKAT